MLGKFCSYFGISPYHTDSITRLLYDINVSLREQMINRVNESALLLQYICTFASDFILLSKSIEVS